MVLCSAHPVLCCSLSASRTLQAWLLGPVGGGGGLFKPTQSWGLYPGYGLTRKTRCVFNMNIDVYFLGMVFITFVTFDLVMLTKCSFGYE